MVPTNTFCSANPRSAILFLFIRTIIAVWYELSVPLNYFGRPFALRFIKRNIYLDEKILEPNSS